MTQTVLVSQGAVEYSWPVTVRETTGDDISADPVRLSLGTYTEPGTWVIPAVDEPQTDTSTRVAQMLIDATVPPGTYHLWVRVTDTPEVVPRRAHKIVVA
jgi:hypothetical protein